MQHQPTTGRASPAMGTDEDAQASGVDQLDIGEVDDQVASAAFDRGVQGSTDAADGRHVEATREPQIRAARIDMNLHLASVLRRRPPPPANSRTLSAGAGRPKSPRLFWRVSGEK
jgi:hypothetical protein